MKYYLTALLLAGASLTAYAVPDQLFNQGKPNLVGKWTWVREQNNCTEVYDYRADGKLFVTSGEERTEQTYTLSEKPTAKGFFRLTSTIVKDHGGWDCGDTNQDSTGSVANIFIMFNKARDSYITCYEESLARCFGPLKRMPD